MSLLCVLEKVANYMQSVTGQMYRVQANVIAACG